MAFRVRFAPSPTGYLHVGGARTALYCYLLAKKHQGEFILRIEDTDVERSTDESLRMQIDDLKWLGLNWDEGPHLETLKSEGELGPYRQSERTEIYKKYADEILRSGQAFYCFLKDEEIDRMREAAQKKSESLQILSPYRDMSLEEAKGKIAKGESAVIRFKVPADTKEYKFNDLVRGEVKFPSNMVGDFVLIRTNGMPVYNFCCAVDDALMKMTHVFRAEEHLSNTLRQMMIYEALGFSLPQFGHLSLILGEDKQKLSKRHGATSVHEYAERGFLPEALKNFVALLGWSHPEEKEILSEQELIDSIDWARFNPAPAVFDETKLKWMNSQYLRNLPHEELWTKTKVYLDQAGFSLPEDPQWQDRAMGLMKNYMETLVDGVELFRPLSLGEFVVADEAQDVLTWESTVKVVEKWKEIVTNHPGESFTEEEFGQAQNTIKIECEVKGKHLFMPIRTAIIGKPHGAELKILVPLMSKESLISRADKIISLCHN